MTAVAATQISLSLHRLNIHPETTPGAGLAQLRPHITALQAMVKQDIAIKISKYITAALGAASYSPHYHNTSTINGILKLASYVPDSSTSS
jgi:hypothetical protein